MNRETEIKNNIAKSFGADIEKGKKTGFYTDTSENRKKGRVGQKYTKAKEEDEQNKKNHRKDIDWVHSVHKKVEDHRESNHPEKLVFDIDYKQMKDKAKKAKERYKEAYGHDFDYAEIIHKYGDPTEMTDEGIFDALTAIDSDHIDDAKEHKERTGSSNVVHQKYEDHHNPYLDELNKRNKEKDDGKMKGVEKKSKGDFTVGDKWSSDFDYDGMIDLAIEANVAWGVENLNALFDSMEDVNYHTDSVPLHGAIKALEDGNTKEAEKLMTQFSEGMKKEYGEAEEAEPEKAEPEKAESGGQTAEEEESMLKEDTAGHGVAVQEQIDRLDRMKGSMKYVSDVLTSQGLDDWEIKEYEGLKSDYEGKIKEQEKHLENLKKQGIL
jgi:hypothetical protein